MIRHILLIKFKQSVDSSQIDTLRALFESMPSKITGVVAVEWGVNDSEENKNKGYTHSVLMTFDNEEARQHYLPHAEHDQLKEVFRPLLEDILVFDYQI
ncbi:Dabb family protein [Shewanella sp. VB17]|uniref:Dabb family protein n=1 Tax=Shewanella sp. VB17 TaxID=2739432 RepID=UPI0015630F19|nr:Dabb family protein [Shewanella sp. VB17]NRD74396.1 Dabb family protein [Shewanella sp. VB17]